MGIKTMLSKAKFNLKQATPDILVAAGIVTSVAAAVGFCRQTRKAIPVMDKYGENVEKIHCAHEDAIKPDALVTYDERAYRKDLIDETVRTVGKLGKIYIVPIALEAVSLGCFIGGHGILKDRNVAITAAYAGIASELKGLHERIVERYGEDVDRELTHGVCVREIEEKSIDSATGSEVTEKKLVTECDRDKNDPNYYSPYARFFDETTPGWCDDPECNLYLLREREHEANVKLKNDGYLFLNDVYDMLGFKRTKAGQMVGWTYSRRGENPYGDNFVSFGLDNVEKSGMRDFVNGHTPYALLDFNVDGKILDQLPR